MIISYYLSLFGFIMRCSRGYLLEKSSHFLPFFFPGLLRVISYRGVTVHYCEILLSYAYKSVYKFRFHLHKIYNFGTRFKKSRNAGK